MTRIAAKQIVLAPLASAGRFLDDFFNAHREATTGEAHVVLKAGDLAREAIVTLTPAHRPGDMTPRYAVSWKDAQDGPYPHFSGTLEVESDEDYGASWIALDGTYAPPGGIGGRVFDAMIGSRIADATARTLLLEIRDEAERHFAVEEAGKSRVT
jgi:hypothetical protein